MKRPVNLGISRDKLEHIRSGTTKKTQIGDVSESKKVIHGKGGKFKVTEKEKKFEEAGVKRKKTNYVMYESKLGTEREKYLQSIEEAKKSKPRPKPEAKPRVEEKIVQKKKKVEYLDNYQYHETKNLNNNKKPSVVLHERLGDIIGGSFEETTVEKRTMVDTGKGPRLYSQQTTKTTTRRDAKGQPTTTNKTTQRSNTASRTVPAQSREMRREIKQSSSNTNTRNPPKKPAPAPAPTSKTTTTKTTTRTTTTRTTTTTKPAAPAKKETRTQSAGKARRH